MTDSMAESMSPSIVGWEGCEYNEVVIGMTIAPKTVTSSGMFEGRAVISDSLQPAHDLIHTLLRPALLYSLRTKVTFSATRYCVICPFSMSTFRSSTQALFTFCRVLLARATPICRASSKLFGDAAMISVTRATDMVPSCLNRMIGLDVITRLVRP